MVDRRGRSRHRTLHGSFGGIEGLRTTADRLLGTSATSVPLFRAPNSLDSLAWRAKGCHDRNCGVSDLSGVRGSAGELIGLLRSALGALPEVEAIEAATWIALVVGGAPARLSVIPTGVVPLAGTTGADSFVNGVAVEIGEYVSLVGARLGYLVANGLREDFLVRSLLDEVTRKWKREPDSELMATGEQDSREAPARHRAPAPEWSMSGERVFSGHDSSTEAACDRWRSVRERWLPESVLQGWWQRRQDPDPSPGAA